MSLPEPYPDLDEILETIGEAGQRVSDIEASEGAAGNISVVIGWPLEVRRRFPFAESMTLPLPAPALAGKLVIVTGSGRRLRNIRADPAANLGIITIEEDGQTGQLHTSPRRLFERVTSEFNSHLAVHADQVAITGCLHAPDSARGQARDKFRAAPYSGRPFGLYDRMHTLGLLKVGP